MSSKLLEVPGVGPVIAEQLEAKGVHTVEELSVMDPEELKVILNSSLATAKKLIKSAKDMTVDTVKLMTGEELQEERKAKVQYISTGSSSLDALFLGGKGVPTDSIVAFYGQFAGGKTSICHQLVVNMKKQYNRKTVWIETEPTTLVTERILEIAEAHGIKFDLKDIITVPAKYLETPTHLFKAYEIIEEKIKQGEDIGLIVIDSFNFPFRAVYHGRETLPNRSGDQGRHMGYLSRLASKYNIAVVLTLQVMGVPDDKSQLGVIKKFGIREPPVVSHVVKHGVNYMVGLEQVSSADRTWRAVIADGPVPRNESIFCITESGITDFQSRKG